MSAPGPRTLFRLAARAEMVTWALLLAAMALKYSGTTDALMAAAGGVHGFVFLCYALITVAVWIDGRWSAGRGLAGLASSVVPFMTVPFERSAARRGEPAESWRAPARAEHERTAPERLVVAVLRHPLVSALAAVVLVALVFTLLLNAGPPTEWGR
ncbi:DUF3817 domain-containing protein [Micrococcus sp. 2A]|uniref:DUF3817 domain-containing protein n=1 Tax=Micrococcus sp. 2A TaxID=3142261 RepID=UPI00260BABD3|nr:DUF3817 domain-containing protein [uncultured Micrococcus sp.]